MKGLGSVLLVAVVCQISISASAELVFTGIGDLEGGGEASIPYGISADGKTVVGISGTDITGFWEGFAWNADTDIMTRCIRRRDKSSRISSPGQRRVTGGALEK